MPELPEVETTRRGVLPATQGHVIAGWTLRNPALRWPVELPDCIRGQRVRSVDRRAKYLLLGLETGTLIIHLGMSGSLRVVPAETTAEKHDHLDLWLDSGQWLRLHDPRRFGSVHWQPHPLEDHWLLRHLGVEPLDPGFTGAYLKARARGRTQAVKNFIMDGRIVVGVGNIYASEALFRAGIRPTVRAGRVTRVAYERLAAAIREVLEMAIAVGGTTLRDFVGTAGNPGYFKQQLFVYGREGQPCRRCGTRLKGLRLGQRATVYCPNCQRAQGFGR